MRTKTLAIKARFKRPSTIKHTATNLDDGTGTGTDQGDIAPDTGDGNPRKPLFRRTNKEIDLSSDCLRADTCIVCDKGDDQVVVCSEVGCPVALHEKCVYRKNSLDSAGDFYCPYCWYKQITLRSRVLRKKVMEAKQCFSDFLDMKVVGGDQENENGDKFERDESKVCEDAMEVDDLGNQPSPSIGKEQEKEMQIDEQSQAHASAHRQDDETGGTELRQGYENHEIDIAEHQQEGTVEDQEQEAIEEDQGAESNKKSIDGVKVQEDKVRLEQVTETQQGELGKRASAEGPSDPVEHEVTSPTKESRVGRGKKKRVLSTATETSVSSSGSTNHSNQGNSFELRPRKKKKYSSAQNTSSVGNGRTKDGQIVIRQSPGKSCLAPIRGKPRRINWTPEEEEVLKKGVQKFFTQSNKNIPWRKILEYGFDVFNKSRTPSDLKDKWRNLLAKELDTS